METNANPLHASARPSYECLRHRLLKWKAFFMNKPIDQPIPIVVDDRECRGAVLPALRADPRFSVQVERLGCGDYRVDARFLFERKTLPDLVESIISGRLFKQALRLADVRDLQPALILEGTGRDLAGCEMSWEAIQGALVNVSLLIGLPVLRSRSPSESINTMAYAARQARTLACGGLMRKGRRPRGKRALQHHILQSLPGIGPARAARLIDHFGSIRSVLGASAEEWAELDGIGSNTAERMDWVVRERRSVYGDSARTSPAPPGAFGR